MRRGGGGSVAYVRGPSGPRRHSGVTVVPHARHMFLPLRRFFGLRCGTCAGVWNSATRVSCGARAETEGEAERGEG